MFWQSSADVPEEEEEKKVEVPELSDTEKKERRRKREERRKRKEAAEAKSSDDEHAKHQQSARPPLRTASLPAELLGLSARARLLALGDGDLHARLVAEVQSVGVVAALLAGFVYGSWERDRADDTPCVRKLERYRDVAIYLASHLLVLAALTATMTFTHVNGVAPARGRAFVERKWALVVLPRAFFLAGALGFVVSVVLMACVRYEDFYWRARLPGVAASRGVAGGALPPTQVFYGAVGVCCPAGVALFALALGRQPEPAARARD